MINNPDGGAYSSSTRIENTNVSNDDSLEVNRPNHSLIVLSNSSRCGVGFIEDVGKPFSGSIEESTNESFKKEEWVDYNAHVTKVAVINHSSSIQPLSDSDIFLEMNKGPVNL